MPLVPPLTVPNTFVNGTVADATQVNANFSALLGWINNNGRVAITTNTTLYVAPGGAGNGLSPSTPLGSITDAYNLLQDGYAFLNPSAVVTILVAAGGFSENVIISGLVPGQQNPTNVVLQGNVGAPTTVSISGTPAIACNHGAMITVQGFRLQSSGGDGLFAHHYAICSFQAIDFGACALSQWKAWDSAIIQAVGGYSISGNAQSHVHANGSGTNLYMSFQTNPNAPGGPGPGVTLAAGLSFTNGFAVASRLGHLTLQGASFSTTTATGPQYNANDNGVIFTGTAGAMVLPGNAPGTKTNGGQYD